MEMSKKHNHDWQLRRDTYYIETRLKNFRLN